MHTPHHLFTIRLARRLALPLTLALTLSGCGDSGGETDASTGASTAGTDATTEMSSSTGSTGASSGTTDASGTETVGATTSGTTEGSTSVGATTEEETSVGATTGFCEIILPEPLPETLEDATVGVYYEVTLSMPGVGQDEALWSTDDALPGWLTLDPDTGVLSGTPDAPGEVSFGVQGTVKDAPPDCGVLPGSRAYTLTVAP
ncbi:MAG: putative Ig domain-containing protein [Myxococcales bacterium]|nr:putative Ig domain-containing protein [Myxococcales bacterium]MCB9751146.1 putative Ig domain-containing protein [Myxococcales bacterium]